MPNLIHYPEICQDGLAEMTENMSSEKQCFYCDGNVSLNKFRKKS